MKMISLNLLFPNTAERVHFVFIVVDIYVILILMSLNYNLILLLLIYPIDI